MMYFIARIFRGKSIISLIGVISAAVLASDAGGAPPPGYKLVWSDEFGGSTLDTNKWVDHTPGPRDDAINTNRAVTVSNGCLTITTYTEGGRHYTDMVSTEGKFERVHGYWEARIQFEDSPGMWSAFWLESPTEGQPVGDPAKAGTEIDICEHRLTDRKNKPIPSRAQQTIHWDGYGAAHKSETRFTPDIGIESGFHTYGMEWTPEGYRFFVDGKVTWTTAKAISNAKEFIILSSSVKDHAWAGGVPSKGYGENSSSKTRMIVDYVRYYSRE